METSFYQNKVNKAEKISDATTPSKHISILIADEVLQICNPLFEKYRINGFSYSRIYPDGSSEELWSDSLALEHTFLKKKYIVGVYTPKYFSNNERYAFLPSKIESYPDDLKRRYTQQLADQREYFNHDYSFMICNKMDGYCEYFIFYAPVGMHSIVGFYFNNLDVLERFAKYFKISAASLIKKIEGEKIISPLFREKQDLSIISRKDEIINNLLTKREFQVASFMVLGKTAREISELLSLSIRTVETHIDHMKLKLRCYKKSELIAVLLEKGLINLI